MAAAMRRLPACLLGAALASTLAPALAQSGASLLPEGSSEIRVGAAIGSAPSAPGSATRQTYLVPQFSGEWSNGVFVEGLALGMRLSADPVLQYGPVMSLNLGPQRPGGGTVHPVFGAFLRYRPMQELGLHGYLAAPAGQDGRGALLHLGAATQVDIAPHHSLAFGAGFNAGDGRYMRSEFGTERYRPSGGVRDIDAQAQWQWQVSRKVRIDLTLRANRLVDGAAASPRTRQRTGLANTLGLSYSY